MLRLVVDNTGPIKAVDTSIVREFARAFVRGLLIGLAWIAGAVFVIAGGFLFFEMSGGAW